MSDKNIVNQIGNEEEFHENTSVEIVDDIQGKEQEYKHDKRVTRPILSKFEIARIIGFRAEQLNNGSPPLVNPGKLKSTIDIAKKELNEGKMALIIKRRLPNGGFEK